MTINYLNTDEVFTNAWNSIKKNPEHAMRNQNVFIENHIMPASWYISSQTSGHSTERKTYHIRWNDTLIGTIDTLHGSVTKVTIDEDARQMFIAEELVAA